MQAARAICDICQSLYADPDILKALELEDGGTIITGDFGLITKHLKTDRREVKWLSKVRLT
jgi:hypothetical protein